ncbi:MAG: DNA/RNA nuclease SfsA, partial [Ruminococcaceae bacterium]|nr:DNA/RNA nuclease SfsA [Oscillospiraceae bacterium]
LAESGYFGELTALIPEYRYGDSRLDFYLENTVGERIFVEVKGVTLEEAGVVSFPDAPTERGIKHLRELARAVEAGYRACVFFVIQMEECAYFTPNRVTHRAFAEALAEAARCGVEICAMNCFVQEDEMRLRGFVEVRL